MYAACSSARGTRTEPFQSTPQDLCVADPQFDFNFLRHLNPCRSAPRLSPAADFR
jgi:hypothetical protein